MKKFSVAFVALLIFVPSISSAATLNSNQFSLILSLLSSFGADASTIGKRSSVTYRRHTNNIVSTSIFVVYIHNKSHGRFDRCGCNSASNCSPCTGISLNWCDWLFRQSDEDCVNCLAESKWRYTSDGQLRCRVACRPSVQMAHRQLPARQLIRVLPRQLPARRKRQLPIQQSRAQ